MQQMLRGANRCLLRRAGTRGASPSQQMPPALREDLKCHSSHSRQHHLHSNLQHLQGFGLAKRDCSGVAANFSGGSSSTEGSSNSGRSSSTIISSESSSSGSSRLRVAVDVDEGELWNGDLLLTDGGCAHG